MEKDYREMALGPAIDCDYAEVLRRLLEKKPGLIQEVNEELDSISALRWKTSKSAGEVSKIKEIPSFRDLDVFRWRLENRFNDNMHRHKTMEWKNVRARLDANFEKLLSLYEMEITDGEPDVVGYDKKTGEYIFCDCSKESPISRRNICYDFNGQDEAEKEKGWKPEGNAVDMAFEMGIEILTPEQYKFLQKIENLDINSWSWLRTSKAQRESGSALVGSRYSNGVGLHSSVPCLFNYEGAFRGLLRV